MSKREAIAKAVRWAGEGWMEGWTRLNYGGMPASVRPAASYNSAYTPDRQIYPQRFCSSFRKIDCRTSL